MKRTILSSPGCPQRGLWGLWSRGSRERQRAAAGILAKSQTFPDAFDCQRWHCQPRRHNHPPLNCLAWQQSTNLMKKIFLLSDKPGWGAGGWLRGRWVLGAKIRLRLTVRSRADPPAAAWPPIVKKASQLTPTYPTTIFGLEIRDQPQDLPSHWGKIPNPGVDQWMKLRDGVCDLISKQKPGPLFLVPPSYTFHHHLLLSWTSYKSSSSYEGKKRICISARWQCYQRAKILFEL